MAHFAELDKDNIVISVHVVANHVITDSDGNDDEQKGIEFLRGIYGDSTLWKQTSYNRTFRKNYAGRGMKYDEQRDAFHEITGAYPSWIFNEDICRWVSPVAYPNNEDGKRYTWNEPTMSWVEVEVD